MSAIVWTFLLFLTLMFFVDVRCSVPWRNETHSNQPYGDIVRIKAAGRVPSLLFDILTLKKKISKETGEPLKDMKLYSTQRKEFTGDSTPINKLDIKYGFLSSSSTLLLTFS